MARLAYRQDQVIADLRHHPGTTARAAADRLGLPAGYVSTTLIQLAEKGVAVRERSDTSAIWRYTAAQMLAADAEIDALEDIWATTPHDPRTDR